MKHHVVCTFDENGKLLYAEAHSGERQSVLNFWASEGFTLCRPEEVYIIAYNPEKKLWRATTQSGDDYAAIHLKVVSISVALSVAHGLRKYNEEKEKLIVASNRTRGEANANADTTE